MKTAGIVLLVLGIVGALVFGVQALQETETFTFLGMDIGISEANWTPVVISGIVLLVGIVMTVSAKRASVR
jgi:hypothetical protein